MRREIALALAILVAAEFAGHRTVLAEEGDDIEGIQARMLLRFRHLDDHVEAFAVVVDNAEADAIVVGARRDGEIGHRRFESAARMVVQQHLALLRNPGKGEHAIDGAAGDGTRAGEHTGIIHRGDEGNFVAASTADFATEHFTHSGREAVGQVFNSFFLAAGKSTLFRISRYPGECGCNDRSVGALPMA